MKDPGWILFVEDNGDDATLTQLAFKEIGFPHRIVHVSDGAKALDLLFAKGEFSGRNKSDTPVLVLLDLKLPKVDGLEVLKAIRNDLLLKHLVVVILTSSREQRDKLGAELLGANLFVQKPIKFDEFTEIAHQIGGMIAAISG